MQSRPVRIPSENIHNLGAADGFGFPVVRLRGAGVVSVQWIGRLNNHSAQM
jgi:hypothetical protein